MEEKRTQPSEPENGQTQNGQTDDLPQDPATAQPEEANQKPMEAEETALATPDPIESESLDAEAKPSPALAPSSEPAEDPAPEAEADIEDDQGDEGDEEEGDEEATGPNDATESDDESDVDADGDSDDESDDESDDDADVAASTPEDTAASDEDQSASADADSGGDLEPPLDPSSPKELELEEPVTEAPAAAVPIPPPAKPVVRPELPVVTRAAEFREWFLKHPAGRATLADGAMGTALLSRGILQHRCLEELNLSLAAAVRDVHRENLAAGAMVLSTNTFGANRMRLEASGNSSKVGLINRAGVRIAREVARDKAYVAGVMGPLGALLEPFGQLPATEAKQIFLEQATVLSKAGVDLIVLETFQHLGELAVAVEAVREACGSKLVVIAQVAVRDDASLVDGTPPQTWAPKLEALPVDAIGVNCGSGPMAALVAIEAIAPLTSKVLSAFPSAGLPDSSGEHPAAPRSPQYIANVARKLRRAGAAMIGGCCGTTPEHIAQMRSALQGLDPGKRPSASSLPPAPAAAKPMKRIHLADRTDLGAKLTDKEFVTIVELPLPSEPSAEREIETAEALKKAGIDAIGFPAGPATAGRMSAAAACLLIQDEADMETILYVPCRGRSAAALQSALMDAEAMGLGNLLCLTGEGYAPAEIDSIGLAGIASRLNQGLDMGGNATGPAASLVIGVAANPAAANLDLELRRLEAKKRSGAEFAMTPPVFDLGRFERFLERAAKIGLPVIAAVTPLESIEHAEYLLHELAIPIPPGQLERMRTASKVSPAKAASEGILLATELAARLRPMAAGLRIGASRRTHPLAGAGELRPAQLKEIALAGSK